MRIVGIVALGAFALGLSFAGGAIAAVVVLIRAVKRPWRTA